MNQNIKDTSKIEKEYIISDSIPNDIKG